MTDYEAIYNDQADRYDRMVSAEDCDGELATAIGELCALEGERVVEVGVGTGRVTAMLLARGAHVIGCDRAPAMLEVARRRLADQEAARLQLSVGDARALPVEDGSCGLAIAGWVFGHLTRWETDWRAEIGRAVDEMERAVRPGGVVAIMETLGTGSDAAGPPDDRLAAYYRWLEQDRGMARRELRTDYQFASAVEAADATRFFFGASFADKVIARGWSRIPEHTGLWRKLV